MPKCSYCKRDYELHEGVTLVMINGTINHLCSSKCKKNLALKRRKVRWVSKGVENKEELQIAADKKKNR